MTDYVVEYCKKGSSAWIVFSDGVSTSTKATVTRLSSDTEYETRVAVSSAGKGSYSSTLTHKTDRN